MSTSNRHHWESRHRADPTALAPPSAFLARHIDMLPIGRALDVACGTGRHTIFLARRGFVVDAIDIAHPALLGISRIAAAESLRINTLQADLEDFPLPQGRYDVVLNTRYLQRSLFAPLQTALRPGGMIIFETFLVGQQAIGHPKNPAYLLAPGELRDAFAKLDVLAYSEGLMTDDGPATYLARLLARRAQT